MRSQLLALTAFILFTSSALMAADKTWTGLGGGADWQEAANWGVASPIAGDALIFPNVTKKTAINTFPINTAFGPLTFDSGGYDISGNLINLNGGIFLNGANATQISLPLQLSVLSAFSVSNASGGLTITQPISGTGGVIKSGSGLLVLNGSNTYSGGTIILDGGVQVGGTLQNPVQINNGYVAGTGTVQGISSLNQGVASIAPGTSSGLGTLTSNGNVTLFGNDRLYFDVNGSTADKLVVVGSINLALTPFSIHVGTAPALNTDVVLIDNDGTDPVIYDAANPSNYLASTTLNGLPYRVLFVGGTATGYNDVVLRRVVTEIPSTFTVSTPNNLISFGDPITFSVQLIGAVGASSGAVVSFWDGAEFIGTASLDGLGKATTPPINTLKIGQRQITALFPGNADYAMTRTTNIVTQGVTGVSTGTSLTATPATTFMPLGTSIPDEMVTLKATVTTTPSISLSSGTVTFYDGTVALATVSVSSNLATHTTTTLTSGSHFLRAAYNQTGVFFGSSSLVVNHTVSGLSTTTDQLLLKASAASVIRPIS